MKSVALGGNPLAELGITPELARRLTNEQLDSVADVLLKELLRQFHSDTGQTASTDNLAWVLKIRKDLAQQPIKQLRKDFINPKRMTDARQRRAAQLEDDNVQLRAQIWEYMQALAGLSEDSLNQLPGKTLHLCDVVTANQENRPWGAAQPDRIFFKLVAGKGGALTRVQGKKQTPNGRRLLGCIPKTKLSAGSIFALMPREPIMQKLPYSGPRGPKPTALQNDIGARQTVPVKSVPLEQADALLRLLTPVVRKDSYLFSVGKKNGVPHLFLEGVIHRI